ncbi:MAG TPA: glycosyl hydrolase 115 family protein, partial [Sediminibacterium sp.]|nr:glycosyl hydrolase 115 family protein [Sediminibacterium sp.]
LDYAWNPDAIGPTDIQSYTNRWAAQQFGKTHAAEIGGILASYAKYNGRRKPELLNENTYSLENYEEAKRVTDDYLALNKQAARIASQLDPVYQDAFFELVHHPVEACSNLQALYYHTALNHAFARQHNLLANAEADTVKLLYEQDSLISVAYNTLANGKWNHMMDQTHIGYTYWQQPPRQRIPLLQTVTDTTGMAASSITVKAKDRSAIGLIPPGSHLPVFYEKNGYVSIEASHPSHIKQTSALHWQVIPDLGKTGDAITVFPVTVPDQDAGSKNPQVDYDFYVYDTGYAALSMYCAPTLNFRGDTGLRFAVSIDGEPLQEINLNKDDNNTRVWESWVANDIIIKTTQHRLLKPGKHILHLWMISPAVVFEKLVLNLGGVRSSYLGPPETMAR